MVDDDTSLDTEARKTTSSRRDILKAIGVSGVGAAGIGTLTPVRAAGDDVKIATHMSGNEVKKTQLVSQRWYTHVQKSNEAAARLRTRFQGIKGVYGICCEVIDDSIGDLRKYGLKLIISKDGISKGIPQKVSEIPVDVERTAGFESMCYTGYKDPINGGNGHQTPYASATLTCRAKKNGRTYMMGCRHAFVNDDRQDNNCNGMDTTHTPWYQGGPEVGEVVFAYQNHDCTLLDKSSDGSRNFNNGIADENGSVVGRVTADGVSYLASNNTTIHKRGRTTCRTNGTILA